jgi:hypothetical protein
MIKKLERLKNTTRSTYDLTDRTEVGRNSIFFLFMRWDFGYCGHYWPIVPAPDDR